MATVASPGRLLEGGGQIFGAGGPSMNKGTEGPAASEARRRSILGLLYLDTFSSHALTLGQLVMRLLEELL